IHGMQRPNLEEWVMHTVFASKVRPMILPFYEEIAMEASDRVAVISFAEGTSKPYFVHHHGREEIYIRVGNTSRRATREQQAGLFAGGGILHPETLPVAGSAIKSMDMERLKDYLANIIKDPEVPESEDEWIQRLISLDLMVEAPERTPVCSIAGLVLFGLTPRSFLQQAGVRVMVFSGNDKSYQAQLDEIIDGPLVGRWAENEEGKRVLADRGIIERFVERIQPFISEEDEIPDEYMRRSRHWHYPIEAVREVSINSLVHRDWTRFVDIEVGCYSDRLEVISPGAMPNSMTVEKMIAGKRSPRNPLIVQVLRDYGYVDARGMGVRTKVIPLMRAHNQVDPVFEATDDYLKTTLPQRGRSL
ncbi:MAG TPA: transcriptional regulator, partial [bacterium]|nr:transcriptional regulator [bacterium]